MKESLKDYNKMYKTHFKIEDIKAYNANLNERIGKEREKI